MLQPIFKMFTTVDIVCNSIQTYKQSSSTTLLKEISNGMLTLNNKVNYKTRKIVLELYERYEDMIQSKQDEAEKLSRKAQNDDSIQTSYDFLKSEFEQLMRHSLTIKKTIKEIPTVGIFAEKVLLIEVLAKLIFLYDEFIKNQKVNAKEENFEDSKKSMSPKKIVSSVHGLQRR